MFMSLSNNGRAAVVLDTGAVSRGSGNQGSNREKDIRKKFVDNDWEEILIELAELEEEREKTDKDLNAIMKKIGYKGFLME